MRLNTNQEPDTAEIYISVKSYIQQNSINLAPMVTHKYQIIICSRFPDGTYTDLIIPGVSGIVEVMCFLLPAVPCLLISVSSEAITIPPTRSNKLHISNNEHRIHRIKKKIKKSVDRKFVLMTQLPLLGLLSSVLGYQECQIKETSLYIV
jgi:hypothetical protein